jgi:GNAT superfamily N-acetyltransferase
MYVGSEDGSEGEFAILMEDGWQSKGMGKLLLSELTQEAKRRGIETVTGIVLRENRRMLGLIDSVLAGAKRRSRNDLYYVCVPLRSLKLIAILQPSGSAGVSA